MRRRALSAATLVAAAVAVVIMGVWGLSAATEPVEDDDTAAAGDGPTCPPEDQVIFVKRADVTVSVYNTGKRKGRAQDTLDMLESMGFRVGAFGNGEETDLVPAAEVRTNRENDPKARLVAAAMGQGTRVVVTDDEYGPGIDVFIGDKFKRVDRKAPQRIKLAADQITCS